jgi:hypothetical protein
MLQNLIFFKADVCGRNLLHRATARCSQFLIDAKVDVNERDSTGEFDTLMHNMRGSTPLHINSDLNTVAVLLANKADVNAENEQGQLPLSFAQSQAHVELLLKYGASLNHASRLVRGGSPLHTAANPVVVASLLMARANIEARHNGLTPLNRAYFQRYGAEAKIPELLNRGADPFQETPELTHWGWYSGHLFNHIDDEFKDVWRKYVRETTTAFLLGTFHARIGQDSSLRRAFASHQPLAEIKILRLIFHMVFHTDNPHYRALK